jgi:hypothetical protein
MNKLERMMERGISRETLMLLRSWFHRKDLHEITSKCYKYFVKRNTKV